MKLGGLFEAGEARIEGDGDTEITGLAYDSRHVAPGTAFFCVSGAASDGHDFALAAVEAGAEGLVVRRQLDLPVAQAVVPNVRAAMAPAAVRFYGDPSGELEVVGITGTNGKTTTAFLVRHLLESAGRRAGLMGTVKQVVGGVEESVVRTTPEAIDLQSTFRRMVDAGDVACAMEVSSHALAFGRARGVRFRVGAFTNLTQDHLDFHSDMEDYFRAKSRLFGVGAEATLPGSSVVNVDDAYGARLADELLARGGDVIRVSPSGAAAAELRAAESSFDAAGATFRVEAGAEAAAVALPLPGDFNVANALIALGVARALGIDMQASAAALAGAPSVPGRFEPVDAGQPFTVVVDYAHTPDSLENVLFAALRLTQPSSRVICVFGAGGDRDRLKRPLMGRIAEQRADIAIVTSDNPRSENPGEIIEEILVGVDSRENVIVESDRRQAIARAIAEARPGDLVVIAGKGHEQGQEFEDGRKLPFDDRAVAREELVAAGFAAPA